MDGPLKAAILIVSTTAAKDPSADASASVLRDVFTQEGAERWRVSDEKIVTDDALDIQKQIMQWTDGPDNVNLVITTGGTGFAVADSTPEVTFKRFYTVGQVSNSQIIGRHSCASQAGTWLGPCHVIHLSRRYTL